MAKQYQIKRHEVDGNPRTDSANVGKAKNPTRATRAVATERAKLPKGSSTWFTKHEATK